MFDVRLSKEQVSRPEEMIDPVYIKYAPHPPSMSHVLTLQDIAGVDKVPGGRVGQHKGHEDQGVQRSFRP